MGEAIKAAERTRSFAVMTSVSLAAHGCCQPLSSQGCGWVSVGPQGRCCEMPMEGSVSHPHVRPRGAWDRGVHGLAPAWAGDQGSRGTTCPPADATARLRKTVVDPVPGTL